jgi:hypothetical protein
MTTWHATPTVLSQFATDPEAVDANVAASVELHLLQCGECRAAVAAAAPSETRAASWDAVADRIDRPKPSLVERLLRRFGVTETVARLVGATWPLQLAWLAALAVVVGGAVLAAQHADNPAPFLLVAPLLPLATVAIAFRAGADPAGEAGAVVPVAGVGLVLRRAVAVVGATLVVLLVGALTLPHLSATDATWVVPALALSLGSLALSTWMRVETAAGILAAGWLGALWTAALEARGRIRIVELAPLAAPGQLAFAVIAVASIAVLVARRDTFATLGRTT